MAHNVTSEEIDRLPKGRSFQSIALTAPSVTSGEIEGGFQVNGASGAENSFTVDGVVTNGLIYGQSRQNTVFEYLQEVQVKTTGISAEYGGALGGVISAVTQSGGNTYRGEGHYYFQGSALAARARNALAGFLGRLDFTGMHEAALFQVPTPLQGASTRMPSKRVLEGKRSEPSQAAARKLNSFARAARRRKVSRRRALRSVAQTTPLFPMRSHRCRVFPPSPAQANASDS